jgi:hypothetical protein
MRRFAPEKSVEHPLADVAHGRGVTVGVGDFRVGRQKRITALAAPHLILQRMPRAQQRAEFTFRVARQLRNHVVDVDAPPVHGLVAKQRSVLLVNIRPDRY